jgi:hypothetical protein
MSDENQTKQEAVVEVITDAKSESSKAKDSTTSSLKSLTNWFDDLFNKKLPKLPKGFLDFLVQYMLILNIIGIILKSLAILSGVIGLFTSITLTAVAFKSLLIVSIISIVLGILGNSAALFFAAKAHTGLESKKAESWNCLYNGWLVAMIFGLLSTATSFGNIASFNSELGGVSNITSTLMAGTIVTSLAFALAFDAIIMYIIFQVRSYYKN